eukprot:TRINITY_DN10324_c0_g1_i2.p1 TRINITY_DN10324_c0_g1~~TRINITY_DN10324_c0_g1_i2.p1  ORF type:complete len:217 (-),score=49.37 TRINITY_DN10324_c0_g1_i2:147-797(-)
MMMRFVYRAYATFSNTKARGDHLEKRVQRILYKSLYFPVRRNILMRDKHGNLSEIDVKAGWLFPRYVECKNYGSMSVPLEDVAKFKEVLRLLGIPARRGLFVTTSTFSPRATTIGIKTVDGTQLRQWERRATMIGLMRIVGYTFLVGLISGAGIMARDLYEMHQTHMNQRWPWDPKGLDAHWDTLKRYARIQQAKANLAYTRYKKAATDIISQWIK